MILVADLRYVVYIGLGLNLWSLSTTQEPERCQMCWGGGGRRPCENVTILVALLGMK